MFKKLMSVILVLTMVMSLSGCGGKKDTSKDDDTSTKTSTSADNKETDKTESGKTDKEPIKRQKVTVISWWDVTKSESLQRLKTRFEELNPDLELEFTMVGSGYADKILTMIAGGGDSIPDVMMLAMDKVPKFADSEAILCLDEFITDDYINSLYPVVKESCRYKGKVYSVARDVTTMAMYCNKAMFEEAGVPIPSEDWTIEEFIDTAKRLTKADENGKPIQWGFYFPKYADGIYDWLIGHGGTFANEDGTKCTLDTPESKEALQFLYDLIYTHKVVPSESQAKQYGKSSLAPIVAGKVAMTMGGLSACNNFNTASPAVEYVVVPLPKMKGKSITHSFVNTWAVPRGAKKPELSWRVLEFLSGKEGQQIVLDTNMGLPASKDVDTSEFVSKRPDNHVFIEGLDYTVPFETFVNGAQFYTIFKEEGEKLWLDEADVDKVANNIIKKSEELFE